MAGGTALAIVPGNGATGVGFENSVAIIRRRLHIPLAGALELAESFEGTSRLPSPTVSLPSHETHAHGVELPRLSA